MKTEQMFLVAVKVQAPAGYKPRCRTEKGIVTAHNPGAKEKAEEIAVKFAREAYQASYPDLKFIISAKAEKYNACFWLNDTFNEEKEENNGNNQG